MQVSVVMCMLMFMTTHDNVNHTWQHMTVSNMTYIQNRTKYNTWILLKSKFIINVFCDCLKLCERPLALNNHEFSHHASIELIKDCALIGVNCTCNSREHPLTILSWKILYYWYVQSRSNDSGGSKMFLLESKQYFCILTTTN